MQKKAKEEKKRSLPFSRTNFILLGISVFVIVVGFWLMAGGRSPSPEEFNYEEIYSFRRITLAPLVVLVGYALAVVSIFWGTGKKK